MKIGLVCPYNIYKGGGVQECVKAIQTELAARGHQARIITPQPRAAATGQDDSILLLGTAADIKSPFHTTAQVSVSVNTEAVDKLLAEEQFDVLHFHEPWVPVLSRQILTRSRAKNIATFHAKLPETIMSRTIERVITPYTKSIMKYLDGLTAVSETAAEYARTLTGEPVTIIPNGIDLAKYQKSEDGRLKTEGRTQPSDSAKTILYIGRLEKRKGAKYLLQAYVLLSDKNPDTRLVIAGDGPDRAKLEVQARSLGLKNVDFVGFVDEATKHRLFQEADVISSPALYGESFGIVLLEAMASGVPVVAGDNPGYKSVMEGRGALSIVNPKDSAEFARRLELFLYDGAIREAWQDWASVYVEQFDYPLVVDKYEQLYKDILKS